MGRDAIAALPARLTLTALGEIWAARETIYLYLGLLLRRCELTGVHI